MEGQITMVKLENGRRARKQKHYTEN